MPHTRQTQVLEFQSQSLPSATLIHTIHTQLTSHHNHSLTLSISLSLSLSHTHTHSQYQSITHTSKTITQYHSPLRMREVNCAPHPADASAWRPESVTPSFNPVFTQSINNSNHTKITHPLSLTHKSNPSQHLYKYTHQQQSHKIPHRKE